MCTEKRRGAACCAPTSPYPDSRVLRPAARPSAAVAVASAPAPAPTAPVRRCRPPAAVAATGRTRSAPPTPAAAAPAPPPLGSRPRAFTISPAAPLGRARRGRRAVGTVTAVTYLPTIPRRECHPVTAATLHRIALAHRRRVGPPPGDQRAIGDAEPRAHAAHRRVRAEPVPEGHLDAGARAHPVDEQVARAVGEAVAAAVVVRPIPVPVKAVPEAEAVGPVEDRIVAQERIVKERIVAGAVEGPVAIAVRPAVAEAHGRIMGIVREVVRPRPRQHIGYGAAVEAPLGGHALHHVEERRFFVVSCLARVEHAVVPMVAAHELVELERRGGAGCEHQPRAFAVVHEERFTIAPPPYFDGLVAAPEVVVRRVEREQHPHAPLG